MGADLDKVANLYSSRNYHNLFMRSFLLHFFKYYGIVKNDFPNVNNTTLPR